MLETTLTLENQNCILLDFTTGEHGAILSKALKGKKHIKSVLVYPKGKVADAYWQMTQEVLLDER